MSSPAVSIVIPVFNRRELVREAIDSALSEGRSTPLELIVVDDCSTDGTWEVLGTYGDAIRRLRNAQNSGQCVARNAGLDAVQGRYVKFLDSDDVLVAGHLARELQRAESAQADIVVSGWLTRFPDGATREWSAPRFDSIVDEILAGVAAPTSAALYRRDKCVRWDPSLRKLDDWDYFCQAALSATTIATEEGPSYEMREHTGQRATDASMLVNAREHHAILHKIESRLANEGKLDEARRRRLAQYFYKELRVLSLHDRDAFDAAMHHIDELDPHFAPVAEERQAWMRFLARVLGARRAILLHSAIKTLVKRS